MYLSLNWILGKQRSCQELGLSFLWLISTIERETLYLFQWCYISPLYTCTYLGHKVWNRKMKHFKHALLWRATLPFLKWTFYLFWLNFFFFWKMFVCLFDRSCRAEAHLGPDETRLEQNAQTRLKKGLCKHAGQLFYENVKREKQIWRYEIKEKKTMATPNKSSWTILMSAFGTRERIFFYWIVSGTDVEAGQARRQLLMAVLLISS